MTDQTQPADLGRRLRQLRSTAGMTQHELAHRAGVRLDTLRSIEQGRTANPGVFTVLALSDALGTSLDELTR